jgi:hypothetical protein
MKECFYAIHSSLTETSSKGAWCISGYDRDIYHLLRRAFGQGITISKIVDLDVFDIISVGYIHLTIYVARTLGTRRGRFCGRTGSLPVGISGSGWMGRCFLWEYLGLQSEWEGRRHAEFPSLPEAEH